nr:MAG TPA: hypothetical protein [Caudoviricetes sp.]
MKVYVLIKQKPLKVKTYTSLQALFEDNDNLGVSKSKLDKWDFDKFDLVDSRFIISKTESLTTGDVRKNKNLNKEAL